MTNGNQTIEQRVGRDRAAWNTNTACGYADAMSRWLGHVEDVAQFLKANNPGLAEKSWKLAKSARAEAAVWFNRSNHEFFRTQALLAEVKALRAGHAITYAQGCDPVQDDWKMP